MASQTGEGGRGGAADVELARGAGVEWAAVDVLHANQPDAVGAGVTPASKTG